MIVLKLDFPASSAQEVTTWAEAVLALEFDTVVPSHTAAPVRDGKAAFAAAFPAAAARHEARRQHAGARGSAQPPATEARTTD